MPFELADLLAGFSVPQSYKKSAFRSEMTGQNAFTIGGEINAADLISDAGESLHFVAVFEVPEPKRAIKASRNQAICRGGESHRVDPAFVALQRLRDLARLDIADSDDGIVLVSSGELPSVVGYRQSQTG